MRLKGTIYTRWAAIAAAAAAMASCTSRPQAPPAAVAVAVPQSGIVEAKLLPDKPAAATPELLARGKEVYGRQCAPCHGVTGKGDGQAAYLLYPKPRDLVLASLRMVSTWEGKATDEDLYYTISRGMPGSAMPSWAHLPETDRWALVHYVKSLAKNQVTIPAAAEPATPGISGEGLLKVGAEPPDTAEDRAKGHELFIKSCAPCHGLTAKGDGAQEQKDEKGYPTRPRDLTLGVYKGDPSAAGVYRRIVLGLPGSPMPSSAWSYPNEAWSLVHYVRSLSSEALVQRVEMRRFNLVAKRVPALPDHPDSGIWRDATPVNLHLMPLWWRTDRPEELTVRAVHDGTSVALLLGWQDDSNDHTAIRVQDFRDAAAVELSPVPDPPFFAMGEKGSFVDVWMWKSEKQADVDAAAAFQDIEEVYPRLAIDSYPNASLSGVEQPARHALTLASDPTFVTAWGAGNIVADPRHAGSAEELRAQGFGTLRAHPGTDQKVFARGVYREENYRVFFRRTLAATHAGATALVPGARVPIAFAVWNGSAGDRDGKKSVTIWQDLWLEQ